MQQIIPTSTNFTLPFEDEFLVHKLAAQNKATLTSCFEKIPQESLQKRQININETMCNKLQPKTVHSTKLFPLIQKPFFQF